MAEFIDALKVLLSAMSHDRDYRTVVSHRGRPRVPIDNQQLEFLVESQFRTKDIAQIFGCSTRTIERRKRDLQLTNYSSITDAELDDLVHEITHLYSCCGEKSVSGRLHSRGIRGRGLGSVYIELTLLVYKIALGMYFIEGHTK